MNKTLAIASLALLTSSAWAHHKTFGDNPDMYQSPHLDHGLSGYDNSMQKGGAKSVELDGYQDIGVHRMPTGDTDQNTSRRGAETTFSVEDSQITDLDGYRDINVN